MNLRTRWTAALRSGHYQQTTHVLHNRGGFCCLGVLCDIVDPTWEGQVRDYTHPTLQSRNGGLLSGYGLRMIDMSLAVQGTLVGMNDDRTPFSTIADWIDTHDLQTGDPLPPPVPQA